MNTLTKQKHECGDEVSKAVDKVLRKIFGNEATLLIYKYLENCYSLRRDEIAEKIDIFAEGLEKFLRSGAYVIERKILEDIYSSYGLIPGMEFESRSSKPDFVSQMEILMQKA